MTASGLAFGRKVVILSVLICVAAMFVTSFIYRMNHPNLFVEVRQQGQQVQDHDHDGDGVQDHGPEEDAGVPGMGGAMGGTMAKVREFMAAVENNPDDLEAQVNLGKAFLLMRAWDRAIEPLEKAHALAPEDIDVLKALGIAYFNKEDFTHASEAYDKILAIEPHDTLALFNLGVMYKYYFEKTDVARTYFEKVLSLEKDDQELIKVAKQELEG